jgi:hypothetical protein
MTVENQGGYQTEKFAIFGDPSKTLVRPVKCRVTEASVTDQHAQALAILQAENGADWIK